MTTQEQDHAIQVLNDRWGVARWDEKDDGELIITLDDGDVIVVGRDGSCPELP